MADALAEKPVALFRLRLKRKRQSLDASDESAGALGNSPSLLSGGSRTHGGNDVPVATVSVAEAQDYAAARAPPFYVQPSAGLPPTPLNMSPTLLLRDPRRNGFFKLRLTAVESDERGESVIVYELRQQIKHRRVGAGIDLDAPDVSASNIAEETEAAGTLVEHMVEVEQLTDYGTGDGRLPVLVADNSYPAIPWGASNVEYVHESFDNSDSDERDDEGDSDSNAEDHCANDYPDEQSVSSACSIPRSWHYDSESGDDYQYHSDSNSPPRNGVWSRNKSSCNMFISRASENTWEQEQSDIDLDLDFNTLDKRNPCNDNDDDDHMNEDIDTIF